MDKEIENFKGVNQEVVNEIEKLLKGNSVPREKINDLVIQTLRAVRVVSNSRKRGSKTEKFAIQEGKGVGILEKEMKAIIGKVTGVSETPCILEAIRSINYAIRSTTTTKSAQTRQKTEDLRERRRSLKRGDNLHKKKGVKC